MTEHYFSYTIQYFELNPVYRFLLKTFKQNLTFVVNSKLASKSTEDHFQFVVLDYDNPFFRYLMVIKSNSSVGR